MERNEKDMALIPVEEQEKTKLNNRTLDTLFEAAGTNGWRNYLIFFLCSCANLVGPMYTVSYQFLGATPDYWCKIPELTEANWTQAQIRAFSTPNRLSGQSGVCEMMDYNYTLAAELGFDNSLRYFDQETNVTKTLYCETREFDLNEPLTVVTKWDLVCDRRALYSTTQSAIYIGFFIGSMTAGYFCDMIGRRKLLLFMVPAFLLVGIVTAFSTSVLMYIILKCVIAIIGMYFGIVAFVLALELCSHSQRSFVGAMFAIPWAIGYMLVPGIAYFVRSFFYLQVAVTLPALILLPAFWFVPESPRWLVLKGRYEEAIQVFRDISTSKQTTFLSKEEMLNIMEGISKKGERNVKHEKSFWRQIFYKFFGLWVTKGWRLILPILCFCWFTTTMVYYGVSLNPPDLRTGKYMYIFLGGLLEVPAYLLIWPATTFLGRKKTMVILYFTCAAAILGAMGVQYFANDENISSSASGANYSYLLALSLTGKLAITSAFQLIWMYTLELVATEFRSVVIGEASVFGRIGSLFSPYIVDLLSETKEWSPHAIFGSLSVMCGFFFLLLPETRDMNLAEFTADHEATTKVDVEERTNTSNL